MLLFCVITLVLFKFVVFSEQYNKLSSFVELLFVIKLYQIWLFSLYSKAIIDIKSPNFHIVTFSQEEVSPQAFDFIFQIQLLNEKLFSLSILKSHFFPEISNSTQ